MSVPSSSRSPKLFNVDILRFVELESNAASENSEKRGVSAMLNVPRDPSDR
jgi:hypothetical protein